MGLRTALRKMGEMQKRMGSAASNRLKTNAGVISSEKRGESTGSIASRNSRGGDNYTRTLKFSGLLSRMARKLKEYEMIREEKKRKSDILPIFAAHVEGGMPSASTTPPASGIASPQQVSTNTSGEGGGLVEVEGAPAFESLTEVSEETLGFMKEMFYLTKEASEESKKEINLKYPLVPPNPKPNEPVYAWAHIHWDPKLKGLIYEVHEPEITPAERQKLEEIKRIMEDKIDISLDLIGKGAAINYLKRMLNKIVTAYGFNLTPRQRDIFEYYILRDFIGLGKIQPLMNDPNIEDISCDGVSIPVFVYHRNPRIGSLRTNIVFESNEELDEFVIKLAQWCGRSISVAEPLLDGSLPDGSRVQAVLSTDIARRGSNFTIRKFSKEPLTPVHLMEYGTINAKALAYLWYVVEHNGSMLVSGPTASGKTTILNSISLFIKPEAKIVSIEDTPELRLPHEHWVPEVARTSVSGGKMGEVTMFDLVRAALRQRPDYIIVGEVRGEEAYVLFQGMATGHAGLATIHADSLEKLIDRLTTPPINLPPSLLEILDVIILVKRFKYKGEFVRRVTNIYEVKGYDAVNKKLRCVEVFTWNPRNDEIEVASKSYLLEKMKEIAGMNEKELAIELSNREKLLQWAKEKGIKNYRDLGRLFAQYYSDPARVMEMIGE